jgi:hypothetical protein
LSLLVPPAEGQYDCPFRLVPPSVPPSDTAQFYCTWLSLPFPWKPSAQNWTLI